MRVNSVINEWLDTTIVDLIKNYDRMGLRASGEYADALEPITKYRTGGVNIQIMGTNHSQYMENGTVGQSNPSPEKAKKLYPLILKWIEDKRLGFDNQRAFAIALSIVYNGIKVPNPNNAGDVISGVLTQSRIDGLLSEIGLVLKEQITSSVIKEFA